MENSKYFLMNHYSIDREFVQDSLSRLEKIGLDRDLNPGPRAPKARIIPLDHQAALIQVQRVSVGGKIWERLVTMAFIRTSTKVTTELCN